jgi:hypothetical protein
VHLTGVDMLPDSTGKPPNSAVGANRILTGSCAPSKKPAGYGILEHSSTVITWHWVAVTDGLNLPDSRSTGQRHFPLGFSENRAQARLLVTKPFSVNGRRTDIPPCWLLRVISSCAKDRASAPLKEMSAVAEDRNIPAWLSRDLNQLSGSMIRLPERSEIDGNLSEQLIVEYYSR